MFEKVNPSHPDKVADRVAGAIVDLAYKKSGNPRIAVEVLLGHGQATVMIESSEEFSKEEVAAIVERIAGELRVNLVCVKQDEHLAKNQEVVKMAKRYIQRCGGFERFAEWGLIR